MTPTVAVKGTATSEMLMAEVRQWFEEACGGKAKAFAAAISKGTDGKLFRCASFSADCMVSTLMDGHSCSPPLRNLLRWPNQRFTQQCEGDEDLGHRLYQEKLQVVLIHICRVSSSASCFVQELRLRMRAAGGPA